MTDDVTSICFQLVRCTAEHLTSSLHISGLTAGELFIHVVCLGQIDLVQPILLLLKPQLMSNLKSHLTWPLVLPGLAFNPGDVITALVIYNRWLYQYFARWPLTPQ